MRAQTKIISCVLKLDYVYVQSDHDTYSTS